MRLSGVNIKSSEASVDIRRLIGTGPFEWVTDACGMELASSSILPCTVFDMIYPSERIEDATVNSVCPNLTRQVFRIRLKPYLLCKDPDCTLATSRTL